MGRQCPEGRLREKWGRVRRRSFPRTRGELGPLGASAELLRSPFLAANSRYLQLPAVSANGNTGTAELNIGVDALPSGGEAFDLVNHLKSGAANTTAANSAQGTITSPSNRPRMVQLAARVGDISLARRANAFSGEGSRS